MSGDYTRFTFDPRKRFAGVQMQQGRVQLDSDWNEQGDVLRERTRLLTLDTGGEAWVAWLTTPNAFLIGAIAGPPADLSIGVGRIYVDGRLAEVFDGEGVTYLNQPFLPTPPLLNPGVDTLVYLDLWEREVTWAEDTELLDVALGGVDTTTRVQQIWQVKLHEQRGTPAECGVDLDALFPPSAGRLTTSAVAPPAPDDPCILPPNAGYRGIENRLYRVEVQVGGALGTARFKWSRDNGSIVSRVSAIAVAGGQSRITVNRIGRDEILRFRIGDWVTLTDDHRELNGEAGQMARVIDIDEAARVVVLDRAVPTAGRAFGATAAAIADRNTRLQRWDQRAPGNVLDGDGLMATAAGPIDLEDGVQVSFSVSPAGGVFNFGDYWVFAARTADASVEPLTQEPPRGIHHQYLQLAAIPAGSVPIDCRPPPPRDEGCCTFVVRPGEDIQAAINALPPAGGCVCLKAGLHPIDAPLVIQRDNVTLHGESMGAIVFNRRGTGLLAIRGAEHDRVYNIVFRQGEAGAEPVIYLEGVNDCGIADCRIEVFARAETIGIFAVASEAVSISTTGFTAPAIGVWFEKGCQEVTVSDCSFEMPETGPNLPSNVAVLARAMRGFATIENNVIERAINGVLINDTTSGQPFSRARLSRVSGNRIALAENPNAATPAYGVDAAAAGSIVEANHIVHNGGRMAAIRLCGSGSRATGNIIVSNVENGANTVAIMAGHEENDVFAPVSRISVTGNIIEGRQNGIGMAGVSFGEIAGNILGREGESTILAIALNTASDCIVAENELIRPFVGIFASQGARNTIENNRIEGGSVGVAIASEQAPTVGGCRLTGLELFGIIALGITQRCDMTGNRVIRCGSRAATATAIGAFAVFGEWHVESNEIMDTGLPPDVGGPVAAIAYGISGDYILEARVESNLITYSAMDSRNVANEDRALRMRGYLDMRIPLGGEQIIFGFPAQIANNKFIGPGATALVELREDQINDTIFLRFERALYSGNYCSHFSGPPNDNRATVHLRGRALTVSGNHVKALTRGFFSYHLNGVPGTFLGNVSHGPTLGRAAAVIPDPEAAFNSIM